MAKKAEGFTTFIPAESFTGWPMPYEENRDGVAFKAGVESGPVPESFAALMREKGLVADQAQDRAADTADETTGA